MAKTIKKEKQQLTLLPDQPSAAQEKGNSIEPSAVAAIQLLPAKFDTNEQAIALLKEKYANLEIKGVDDKEGFKAAHEARIEIRDLRIAVDNRRKEVTKQAREWIEEQNEKGFTYIALLKEIEDPLQKKEDEYNALVEARRQEKARKEEEARQERLAREREALQARVKQCIDAGCSFDGEKYSIAGYAVTELDLRADSEADFNEFLDRVRVEKAAADEREEAARKAREAHEALLAEERRMANEKIEAENQRIREANAELERQRAALKKEQDDFLAEQKRIADAKQAEADKELAEARKIIEEQKKQNALKLAKEQAEREKKLKEAREEALRPDKEKLRNFAATITALVPPELKDAAAKQILLDVNKNLKAVSNYILNRLNTL